MKLIYSLILLLCSTLVLAEVTHLKFTADSSPSVFVISNEIYKEINKELKKEGLQINVVKRPLLRGIQEVNYAELDGDVGRSKTKALLDEFPNLRPLDESIIKIKYLTISKAKKLDTSKKLKYGVLRGVIGAKDIMPNFEKVYLRTEKQKYEMLKNNRIDFFMVKKFNDRAFYNKEYADKNKFILGKKPYIELDVVPILNHKSIIHKDKLTRAVKRAKNSGAIDNAIERAYQMLIRPQEKSISN